ncbi:MAG: cytochrome C [Bacillota bacterium]
MTQPNAGLAGGVRQQGLGRGTWITVGAIVLACVGVVTVWSRLRGSQNDVTSGMHVTGGTAVQAGRYLVMVGGCNDCHTPLFMQKGMAVPESEWLTGVPVGWRGPWGTTYGSNLRLLVQMVSEDGWVKMMQTRDARPPMPWTSLHATSEPDLRAVYQYIKDLGPKGESMPGALPPGQEPTTPYLVMEPQMPKGK